MKVDLNRIDALIGVSEDPCISIIVPTFRISHGRKQNTEMIRKAKDKALAMLKRLEISDATRKAMEQKIVEWAHIPDQLRPLDGLGYFLSPSTEQSLLFPFPVSEKVTVGTTFEKRELIYLRQFVNRYYILVLGKQSVRLLEAIANSHTEVTSEHFPMQMEEEYEYEHPAPGSSYGYSRKAFEQDKAEMTSIRIRQYLKAADRELSEILLKNNTVFVVAGTAELVAEFERLSQNADRLAGKVFGSFRPDLTGDLRQQAWLAYSRFLEKKLAALISAFGETPPAARAEGLKSVWKASVEGKGMQLLVEKDFKRRAYLKDQDLRLYFHRPVGESVLVTDIVDEIIETVLSKGGQVSLVDNDRLAQWGRIVLFQRY